MTFRAIMAGLLTATLLFVISNPVEATEQKVVAKKTAKPIPSPSPKWPPQGFKGKDGVYAKVPSSKELVGLLSAKRTLQSVVRNCQEFACGAVIAAAETGCKWWEVTSRVLRSSESGPGPVTLGSLTTYSAGSKKKAQTTIFLVSGEKIERDVFLTSIRVICHRSASDKPTFGHTYLPVATPTPIATN
jgi:hypothetical protein